MLKSRSIESYNRHVYNKVKLNGNMCNYFQTVNNKFVMNAK